MTTLDLCDIVDTGVKRCVKGVVKTESHVSLAWNRVYSFASQ